MRSEIGMGYFNLNINLNLDVTQLKLMKTDGDNKDEAAELSIKTYRLYLREWNPKHLFLFWVKDDRNQTGMCKPGVSQLNLKKKK
jgi:hypothetical protein